MSVAVNCYQVTFGLRVRQLRLDRGETQEEVAHRAGLHVTYLSGIERGVRNPSLISIRALADGLGVPISELFAFEPPPPTVGRKTVCNGHSLYCRVMPCRRPRHLTARRRAVYTAARTI